MEIKRIDVERALGYADDRSAAIYAASGVPDFTVALSNSRASHMFMVSLALILGDDPDAGLSTSRGAQLAMDMCMAMEIINRGDSHMLRFPGYELVG